VDSVNLVFQQSNVLRCGLDQKVEGICGAWGQSLYQRSTWEMLFSKNMVIVCTAQVLLDCLMHSFTKMSRINLLILDESHHAKGSHSYARVMREFYDCEPDLSKRPRIFGMTASPVDVRGQSAEHVRQTARELETLLHSKIATTSNELLASNHITKPEEELMMYSRLPDEFETPLHMKVKARYGDVTPFEKYFRASKVHASELGRWASDMFWSFAFTDEESRKLQIREECKYNRTTNDGTVRKLDAQLLRLKEAAAFVQQLDFGVPTLSDADVSSKVQKLHQWLSLYYERSDDAHCIVFVEKRHTARLLKLIFDNIGGPNLRCGILVGINNRAGEENVSLRSQILTLQKFRRGELNCLFATSVAEEGLDIPQCNVVVRFDLYRTMIGYIQSRGRARHRNSKYLHMFEDGNNDHRQRIMDVRYDENVMRSFCKNLPHDRILDELDEERADMSALDHKVFTDEVSGAKLTYRSALSVLNHFVATFPSEDHDTMVQPSYVIAPAVSHDPRDPHQRGFMCEVILPDYCPVVSKIGQVQNKKIYAKCSAAFEMCIELRHRGKLDEHLLPTTMRTAPEGANAHLAISEKKGGAYPILIKPNFWKRDRGCGTVPACLYLTVVNVDAGLDRPHQPLGLLTRVPLPQLPEFPIYLNDGRPSNIVSQAVSSPIALNAEMLELFTLFTLRIYEDIYNKVYEYDADKISYWVVPILVERLPSNVSHCNPEHLLDLEQIRQVCDKPVLTWTTATRNKDLLDKYFIDPMNGGRRYFSNTIATHLRPQDPVPANVPRQNHKFMSNILDYTDSKWQKSRDITRWNQDQPVLEVEKIPFRRNHLACVEDKEKKELDELKTYICPEPLKMSNVSGEAMLL